MSEQVTIIMPVYNPGEYLRPCLDSLLAQSMKDFRIIAIDDGSTDNSWDVLQEYAAQDARVLPQKNPYNIGAARTRNIGIQLAQGEYLVILDADDYFEPDYLECLWTACKENDLDIVICDFWLRDEKMGLENIRSVSRRLIDVVDRPFSWNDVSDILFQIFYFPPYLKMYSRQFLVEQNIFFQDLHNSNDVYFCLMSMISANRIMHISKPLVHYRYNTGRQISSVRNKHPYCIYHAFLKVYEELNKTGIFTDVCKSFYGSLWENIMHVAVALDTEELCAFRKYGKKLLRDFQDVSAPNYDSFSSKCYFYAWNDFFQLDNGLTTCDDLYTMERVYKNFFCEVNKRKWTLSHWGYGKLGYEFVENAKKHDAVVFEVYDQDSAKWNEVSNPPIRRFDDRKEDTDLVVMTNDLFEQDILSSIKKSGKGIKLFDFTAFVRFGFDFESCIIRSR